jgi:glycyl-tRNA synthetase beta chain
LEEDGVDGDLVQAVAGDPKAVDRILEDPADISRRVELLVELRRSGQLAAVQAVVTRAARLAEKGELPAQVWSANGVVDPGLFEKNSETAMFETMFERTWENAAMQKNWQIITYPRDCPKELRPCSIA